MMGLDVIVVKSVGCVWILHCGGLNRGVRQFQALFKSQQFRACENLP